VSEERRLIDWTGERCVPWSDDLQVVYEHVHRYAFAAQLVAGKAVLDVGSGEGYGSAILGKTAASVLGIDVDPASVAHSRATHASDAVQFVEGSALQLASRAREEFDVVVCFEVLEHVADHDRVLEGIAHVLREDGVLVLSTPDREPYNAAISEPNPFHVREVSAAELRELIRRRFAHVRVWRQTAIVGSRIAANEGDELVERFMHYEDGDWVDVSEPQPMYLVAIASNAELPALSRRSYFYDSGFEAVTRPLLQLGSSEARLMESERELTLTQERLAVAERERAVAEAAAEAAAARLPSKRAAALFARSRDTVALVARSGLRLKARRRG
jgi:SAM-dependent methyltransferase